MTDMKVVTSDGTIVQPAAFHAIAGRTVQVTFALRERAETKTSSVEVLSVIVLDV
jgi:hypothetical protein